MEMWDVIRESVKLPLLGLCIYTTTDYAYPKKHMEYIRSLHGGRMLYLTNIAQYLTILTAALGYLVKMAIMEALTPYYKAVLPVSTTMEGLLTCMFWTLLFIDPKLIKGVESPDPKDRVSLVTDISLHLVPLILLLIDQMDVKLEWNPWCVLYILVLGASYFLHLWYHSRKNGKWEYPILNNMSMSRRILFFVVAVLLGILFYIVLLKINAEMYPRMVRKKEQTEEPDILYTYLE